MSKSVWSGLIPVVAVVALWAPAAQAAWTCDDYLQSCLYAANQDPDGRVREIYSMQCEADYWACESSPVCGDYICQSLESYENSCPADCATGFSSNDLGTEEGICSSSALSTSSSQG